MLCKRFERASGHKRGKLIEIMEMGNNTEKHRKLKEIDVTRKNDFSLRFNYLLNRRVLF